MLTIDGVEMVDVREAAAMARRNPETIRRWVWTGRLAAVKPGNKMLFRRDDVQALLGSSRTATSDASLASWAEQARAVRTGRPGATCRDMVIEDRAGRDGTSADARR